jgi:hypothetical protein
VVEGKVLPPEVTVPTRAEVVTAEEVLPDWAPDDPEPEGLPRMPRAD